MENKTCTVCKIEKHLNNFYERFSECKDCNIKRGVNLYQDNKDEISIEQKIYYEKNRHNLLEEQNDHSNRRNADYKDLLRSYTDLENKLKALKEKVTINDSEKH